MVSLKPRPLFHRKNMLQYLLDGRLGGTQSQSGHGGEEKNSIAKQILSVD